MFKTILYATLTALCADWYVSKFS